LRSAAGKASATEGEKATTHLAGANQTSKSARAT
jgi:hypothetical protein